MAAMRKILYLCFGDFGAVEAIVQEQISPNRPGYILYDRAFWPAETTGMATLMPGSIVDVIGSRKNVLIITPRIPSCSNLAG